MAWCTVEGAVLARQLIHFGSLSLCSIDFKGHFSVWTSVFVVHGEKERAGWHRYVECPIDESRTFLYVSISVLANGVWV